MLKGGEREGMELQEEQIQRTEEVEMNGRQVRNRIEEDMDGKSDSDTKHRRKGKEK